MRPASRALLRRTLLAAIAVLYVLSVPWYRSAGADPGLWIGLPDWVAVALGCYVAVAILNAAAWLLTDVPDAEVEPDTPREPPADPASPGEDGP